MTKIYIKPNSEVIKVEIQQILVGSPDGNTNGLDPNETPIDPGTIDAKGFSFSFEEVEDNE